MRVKALRTGASGRAELGTIEVDALQTAHGAPIVWATKSPGEKAAVHHPPRSILLTVVKGRHTIVISASPMDRTIVLLPGEQILFCDFKPAAEPEIGYSGHSSVAGPEGAILFRVEIEPVVNCDALQWEPCAA